MNSFNRQIKIRYIGICILIAVFFIVGSFDLEKQLFSEEPMLSRESGFYEDSFYLEITAPKDSVIYYTLDGSTPNEQSLVYNSPILVENATKKENIYSARTDVSAGFRNDLIEKYQTSDEYPGYVVPDYPVDKCTVVRAVAVSENGAISEEVNASYFVDIKADDYNGCNIISLITDPDNLFDSEIGIYVTGDIFDNYIASENVESNWRMWEANYRMKGREWERESVFHFFDNQGQSIYEKKGGIRIHGGVSRGAIPRSLNLYSRSEYDGIEKFNQELFSNSYKGARMTLASGGNQLITQFCDYMMTERTKELNFATLSHVPYMMFVNGEYWGFYWLNEKYDENYLEYYYGVNAENVVILKNGLLESGAQGDEELYYEFQNYVFENDMTDGDKYEEVCEMIDMDSYIDYYATLIYIARYHDWPIGNWAVWRAKSIKDDTYSDGRWRWMLFDCNSRSMGNQEGNVYHDTLNYVLDMDRVFRAFWRNEEFREEFKARIFHIADECFNEREMNEFLDKYNEKMIPILAKSWERFYGYNNDKIEEYNKIMSWQREFFANRKSVVESWFDN